jgi:hypothetical protein
MDNSFDKNSQSETERRRKRDANLFDIIQGVVYLVFMVGALLQWDYVFERWYWGVFLPMHAGVAFAYILKSLLLRKYFVCSRKSFAYLWLAFNLCMVYWMPYEPTKPWLVVLILGIIFGLAVNFGGWRQNRDNASK